MIIDMYMWFDLHHPAEGSLTFHYAEYYYKAYEDVAINKRVFSNDWRTGKYVITTPQLLKDTRITGSPLGIDALDHSVSVARFNSGGWPVTFGR